MLRADAEKLVTEYKDLIGTYLARNSTSCILSFGVERFSENDFLIEVVLEKGTLPNLEFETKDQFIAWGESLRHKKTSRTRRYKGG